MNALTNTTMFIIATVLALATPTTPTSATTIVTGTDAGVINVESNRDNTEVTNRDKTGTPRPSNFTQATQPKKKQALTRRACLQAERAGFEPAVGVIPLRRFSKPLPSAARPTLRQGLAVMPEARL